MYVKIRQCASGNSWYRNCIGMILKVDNHIATSINGFKCAPRYVIKRFTAQHIALVDTGRIPPRDKIYELYIFVDDAEVMAVLDGFNVNEYNYMIELQRLSSAYGIPSIADDIEQYRADAMQGRGMTKEEVVSFMNKIKKYIV